MRVCSGAFRTSPVAAVQVEMGEMPLRSQKSAVNVDILGRSART